MSRPFSVLRKRMQLADIFLLAAEIMADTEQCNRGCCLALAKAQKGGDPFAGLYESTAHDAFKEMFPWQAEPDEVLDHWGARQPDGPPHFRYPEDAREARVLALLFCAEMARAGEIG